MFTKLNKEITGTVLKHNPQGIALRVNLVEMLKLLNRLERKQTKVKSPKGL